MKAPRRKRKRRNIDRRIIAYAVSFLIGVFIMLYPTISNTWNNYIFKRTIIGYENKVNKNKKEIEKELKLAEDYNEKLLPKEVPDAFSIRDGKEDKEYEQILNIGRTGMMGYISIPAINIEIPIYHYTREDTLKKGAGHLLGSSLPVGGKGTHSVLSAHRGLPRAKLFSDLNLLEKGDCFYIHVLDRDLKYEVDQILVVEPDQTESLALIENKDYVTLVTCTPYGVNTQRLLVRGCRVSNDTKPERIAKKSDSKRMLFILISVLSGIEFAYVITRIAEKTRNKHERKIRKQKNRR